MDLEFKALDGVGVQFKFDDAGNGSFSGYGSVFNNLDSYGDIVVPGAYVDTIPQFLKMGFVAIGHDWCGTPVAYPTEAREDSFGLYFSAAFHSTKAAQNARRVMRERLEAGKDVGLSIGYRVKGYTDLDDGTRELTKIDLHEISIVTVPANRAAVVTGAKSGPHAGLSFADHSEQMRVIAEEFVARAAVIAGMRAKDGRELSAANRARIAGCREVVDDAISALSGVSADFADLLAATEPKPKGDANNLALKAAALRLSLDLA